MRHENIGEEPTTILPHMMAIDWTRNNTLYFQTLARPDFDPANAFCPDLMKRIMNDVSNKHNSQAAAQGVNTLVNNAARALNINDPER